MLLLRFGAIEMMKSKMVEATIEAIVCGRDFEFIDIWYSHFARLNNNIKRFGRDISVACKADIDGIRKAIGRLK